GLAAGARGVEYLFEVGDAGKYRRNLLEMQFGRIRQQPRHRGFAGAGRAPEHQRSQRARRQHPGQRAVRSQYVILPHHVGQRARAQSVGKRMRRVALHTCGCEQIGRRLGAFRTHPPSVTLICWPPRISVMRQTREDSRVALSRSLVLAIFWLLTARMMSPFWKPTPAAVPSCAISVTTTPSVSASRCSSSATAGEMLETLAPWNGEREVSTISLRPASGAVSSAIVSFSGFPARCTSICAVPPIGRVAKR